MEWIRFLTDEKGRRVAIVDVDQYRERWEDFHDQIVADSRAHEMSIPWEVVKRRLSRKRATRKRTARA